MLFSRFSKLRDYGKRKILDILAADVIGCCLFFGQVVTLKSFRCLKEIRVTFLLF